MIVPPLTNQYLNLTKNSSLAIAVGYPDLFAVFAGTALNQTGQAIEIIGITMAVYLSLSLLTSAVMNWYNARIGVARTLMAAIPPSFIRRSLVEPEPPPIAQPGARLDARAAVRSPSQCASYALSAVIMRSWSLADGEISFHRCGLGRSRPCRLPARDDRARSRRLLAFHQGQIAAVDVRLLPESEHWRVDVTYALGVILLVPLLIPRDAAQRRKRSPVLRGLSGARHSSCLSAGCFGLPHVETRLWGGLLITLVISFTGIIFSLPLGILLALGRRSAAADHPRGVRRLHRALARGSADHRPVFCDLHAAVLPAGNWKIDGLLRVLIGVVLFAGAYMAEVVRGGLQAIPRGQFEGAMALGLGYWRMMGLVILPQALRLVIPGIVNSFISLFKDTSLVLIVAIFDLLGQLRAAFADPTWATPVPCSPALHLPG